MRDGSARILLASAARGRRSLRTPDAPLEPQDGPLYLWRPQRHPHRRSDPDRAAARRRLAGPARLCRQGRADPVRRHQAPGRPAAGRRGRALGAVFHEPPLARRHPDQLEDDLEVDRPAEIARRAARRRRRGLHQEGAPPPGARTRQVAGLAGRHPRHGQRARHDVRDRHQQGGAGDRRGAQAGHSGGGDPRHQLRPRLRRLSDSGQ